MRIIKNIIVAFSLYSQIPMPRFEWNEDDMKHNIVFLPWIGIVIGLVMWLFLYLTRMIELPVICRLAVYSLIPLIITGGFHLDGYMDVQDALKSYKSADEKLEILKDPHIGAFAIIRLAIYSLVWIAAEAVCLESGRDVCIYTFFLIFFMARATSGMVVLKLKHAKKDGMLNMETEKSTGIDFCMCSIQAVVAILLAAWVNWKLAVILLCVLLLHFFYYKRLCYVQFGGITGDTTGFYIVTLEEWLLVATAVAAFFI